MVLNLKWPINGILSLLESKNQSLPIHSQYITGNLRVKDSQTLILTGVINDANSKSISKIPLFGDLPILGRLFRSTSKTKRKSELIILVTPKIINDSESNTSGIGYTPTVKETKELIDSKND